jgi:hypothetical protein
VSASATTWKTTSCRVVVFHQALKKLLTAVSKSSWKRGKNKAFCEPGENAFNNPFLIYFMTLARVKKTLPLSMALLFVVFSLTGCLEELELLPHVLQGVDKWVDRVEFAPGTQKTFQGTTTYSSETIFSDGVKVLNSEQGQYHLFWERKSRFLEHERVNKTRLMGNITRVYAPGQKTFQVFETPLSTWQESTEFYDDRGNLQKTDNTVFSASTMEEKRVEVIFNPPQASWDFPLYEGKKFSSETTRKIVEYTSQGQANTVWRDQKIEYQCTDVFTDEVMGFTVDCAKISFNLTTKESDVYDFNLIEDVEETSLERVNLTYCEKFGVVDYERLLEVNYDYDDDFLVEANSKSFSSHEITDFIVP